MREAEVAHRKQKLLTAKAIIVIIIVAAVSYLIFSWLFAPHYVPFAP
ncbi:MAG: hypothetical protein JRN06_09075 [Nitrososphaerota archaeon]|nr:hypothetical protein [Nitrososphaerota archaeon]